MKLRLIRPYPLIAMATALGALVSGAALADKLHLGLAGMAAIIGGSLLLVPVGLWGNQVAYPLNNPVWSLVFELFANLLYGLKLDRKISKAITAVFLGLLALALAAILYRFGGVESIGFMGQDEFIKGVIRVLTPFCLGVAAFRLGLADKAPILPDIVICMVCLGILCMPDFSGRAVFQWLSIVVLFPALIHVGARAKLSPALTPLWRFGGRLSYPLSLIHTPVIVLCGGLYEAFGK